MWHTFILHISLNTAVAEKAYFRGFFLLNFNYGTCNQYVVLHVNNTFTLEIYHFVRK
jgi:hypothetical protein